MVLRRSRGFLIVLSGPSGAGKNTIVGEVLGRVPDLRYSISASTRPPRPGEVDGVNYFFLSEEEFEQRVKSGDFLEWATVYGHRYGTPRKYIEKMTASGQDVILDIDIQGAMKIKKTWEDAVFVFLLPPSLSELEKRLILRGSDTEEVVRHRLSCAREELEAVFDYDYVIVNDDKEKAVSALMNIIYAERCRVKRCECREFIDDLRR
ncbi:MAG TPA: guanylate kinase [Firmicutes bacterium]|nr:guanylate kinase [Bacillota bacterium]